VGSTVELVGFDTRTTAEGIASILATVPRLLPALKGAALERTWSGLRPWCEDGLPAIGWLPGCEGVTLASGHFKLGIVGSPITAQAVKNLLVDGRVDPLISPFTPDRFSENRP
jgi:glycine oxidase